MGKQKTWSPTDPKHFEGKTLKQLQEMLKESEKFVKEFPKFEFGWHNEYVQELKRRVAEQIGRKKK